MRIYGIKSCDGCRKARRFLDELGLDLRWHDLRADGVDSEQIQRWLDQVGPETLVNRRSTTWRGLDESEREAALNEATAAAFLATEPTLIKRPVFEIEGAVHVGFKADVQALLRERVS